ncbi:DMT family transporter [Roseibium sp.]|uniref:DMT family transporter n=1 Tax=Roseibium sp. TaxID=1936156 RepID=UPI003BB0CC62
MQGILFLILGLAVFSVQDVIMKHFSDQLALQQVIFLRGLVTIVVIALLLARHGRLSAFSARRPVLCIVRGFAGFACFTSFSMALAVLPLADAMPLYYTSPLFVMALAVPLLGETVGWRSWLSILVGFAGVILVARPSAEGLEPGMVLAIAAALAYAIQSLLARALGPTESALGMTFYSQLTFIASSGFLGLAFGNGWLDQIDHPSAQYLFRAWSTPTLDQAALIIALGLIAAAGFYCISQAYRLGQASTVAPFEYSSLPFALLWGWLIWSSVPTAASLIGGGLIIASGLYIMYREMLRKRRTASAVTTAAEAHS